MNTNCHVQSVESCRARAFQPDILMSSNTMFDLSKARIKWRGAKYGHTNEYRVPGSICQCQVDRHCALHTLTDLLVSTEYRVQSVVGTKNSKDFKC